MGNSATCSYITTCKVHYFVNVNLNTTQGNLEKSFLDMSKIEYVYESMYDFAPRAEDEAEQLSFCRW